MKSLKSFIKYTIKHLGECFVSFVPRALRNMDFSARFCFSTQNKKCAGRVKITSPRFLKSPIPPSILSRFQPYELSFYIEEFVLNLKETSAGI